MADRPIMFSAPMVLSLLAGRKTQTRRLATSPLARAAAGDLFFVREEWRGMRGYDSYSPNGLGELFRDYGRSGAAAPIEFAADRQRQGDWAARFPTAHENLPGRRRASMHLPRWATRLTLVLESTRVERLHAITAEDALAEGVAWTDPTEADRQWARDFAAEHGGSEAIDGVYTVPGMNGGAGAADIWHVDPRGCYSRLWDHLRPHPGNRWQDNPEVLVLTFRVEPMNIDQLKEIAHVD